jgi:beta-lactamase superfamily II metal-dependent hydrolase
VVQLEDIAARKTNDDSAPPNGSSFAFLAEFEGRSLLFGADAHPQVLFPALRALARERAGRSGSRIKPLQVDVFKLPHHGSRANVTLELLDLVKARHYVTSTSGRRFKHPAEEAMARIITTGWPSSRTTPTLGFNYLTATTKPWMEPALAERYGYRVGGPLADRLGVSIRLED